MRFESLPILGAFRIKISPIVDQRGFFARRFSTDDFLRYGLETRFDQRSLSFNTAQGTLRGIHFQLPPFEETKLVRCTRGAAFDVIVDVRPSSPTYRMWYGEELTSDNRTTIYIPAGVGHGFQTLVDDTEMDYEITARYAPDASRGFRFDDPTVGIDWPLSNTVISQRDLDLPAFPGSI